MGVVEEDERLTSVTLNSDSWNSERGELGNHVPYWNRACPILEGVPIS